MANSIAAFRVTFVVWVCVSRCTSEYPKVRGSLTDFSLDNIINYVKPYIQSLQVGPHTAYKKSFDQTNVEKAFYNNVQEAINTKIKELLQFFQDDDIMENETDTMLNKDEETTIIEFVPKARNEDKEQGSSKTDTRKYKNMRNKIKLALEKEKVSKKTKKMVTKTLDELIAELLSSQCNWNESKTNLRGGGYLSNVFIKSQLNCYMYKKKLTDDECMALILNVTKTLSSNVIPQQGKIDFLKNFIEQAMNGSMSFLHGVGNKLINWRKDSHTIPSDRYKLRCELVDMEKVKARTGFRRKGSCEDFRICSEELKTFLADFYKSLNETAVSVFRNYAAMYVRDVNTDDSDEKKTISVTINNVSDIVEERVSKAFIKQLSKIKLDDNKNIDTNVEAIKEYVRTTVRHVSKKIKKHLESDLKILRARLIIAVQEDIIINLDADLGNLENKFLGKVCQVFVTCNGEISGSLRKGYQTSQNDSQSKNVYVKVQISLDDELKKSLAKSGRELLRDGKAENSFNIRQNVDNVINNNVRVTRTTMKAVDKTKLSSKAVKLADFDSSDSLSDK